MINNKNGETFISIIIAVIIISIVFISLLKIIEYDDSLNGDLNKSNIISLLEKNTNSIVSKIDTSFLKEKEIFYIYKTGSSINSMTGNENYKYINYLGENIDNLSYKGNIYSRFCIIDKDSIQGQNIKCSIKELIKNKF